MKRLLGLVFLFVFMANAQKDVILEVDGYIETKEYKKAKNILLEIGPEQQSIAIKERLGDVHSYLREWDKAIPIYGELVNRYPNNSDYQFRYGGVIARKAQNSNRIIALTLIGKIKKSFLKAAELDADHIEVRWGLLDLYTALPSILGGSTTKAYNYAEQLKKLAPIEGYFALAYVSELDEKPNKADEYFRKTLSYIDDLDEVKRNQLNYLIGKVCRDYNIKLEKGISHLKIFIRDHSVKDGVPLSHAYYRLAKIYRIKKDRDRANYWIRKALNDDSEFKLAQKEQEIIAML